MVMLVANIGGICNLGKFLGRDLAFILKMQGVCVILLGIFVQSRRDYWKVEEFSTFPIYLLTEGANCVVLPLEKLVLAKGVFVRNLSIKDEISALQQKKRPLTFR